MSSTLTSKGQVTIPKKIRDTLGLAPGSSVEFGVANGEVVIRKSGKRPAQPKRPDRFDRARGKATVKWRADELMELLRGE
jgi:AbrB family looped-hinge helix DNA binding protein